MATPSRHLPHGLGPPVRISLWAVGKTGSLFDALGHQITFLAQVLGAIPRTLVHYRRQTGALLVDMIWGNGLF